MTGKIWAGIVLLLTLTFVLSPAVTDPFMGYTTDQLPFAIPHPPIQPAGYAFAIWGVNYTWLLVSAGFGLWRRSEDPDWNIIRGPLAVSLLVGTFWLWIAGQSAIWGTITIWIMLLSALAAMLAAPRHDRWWLRVPLALYAGWLSAAAFVSLDVTLAGYGLLFDWNTWALIGIAAATGLAVLVQTKAKGLPEYSIPVVWAFVGIIVANSGGSTLVITACGIATIIVALSAIRSYLHA